jgi:hypothetical protein
MSEVNHFFGQNANATAANMHTKFAIGTNQQPDGQPAGLSQVVHKFGA